MLASFPSLVRSAQADEAVEEAPAALHEVLDRRDRLSKRFQSELGIFGGDYLGDEWRNSWAAGGRYYLHLSNAFAVGASYAYTPITADRATSFGGALATNHSHLLDAELAVSNDCAFRAGRAIVECDLFLTLGGGVIYINRRWLPAFVVGGGLKVYTPPPWLAVRFDVNTVLHKTPLPSGDKFNSDISMNAGVSFLFPVRRVLPESE